MKPLSLTKIGNSNLLNNTSNKHNHLSISKKYPLIKVSQNESNLIRSGIKTKYNTSKNSPEREKDRNISEEKTLKVKLLANPANNNLGIGNPSGANNVNNSSLKANNNKNEFNEQEFFKNKLSKNKINGVNLNYTKGDSLIMHKQSHSHVTSNLNIKQEYYNNKSSHNKDIGFKQLKNEK